MSEIKEEDRAFAYTNRNKCSSLVLYKPHYSIFLSSFYQYKKIMFFCSTIYRITNKFSFEAIDEVLINILI